MAGGETFDLAVLLRKHLEDSGGPREMVSCLITLIATCSAYILMYEHSASPWLLMERRLDPSDQQSSCTRRDE